jgi:hypothetical protein
MIKTCLFADQEREAKLNKLGDALRVMEQPLTSAHFRRKRSGSMVLKHLGGNIESLNRTLRRTSSPWLVGCSMSQLAVYGRRRSAFETNCMTNKGVVQSDLRWPLHFTSATAVHHFRLQAVFGGLAHFRVGQAIMVPRISTAYRTVIKNPLARVSIF